MKINIDSLVTIKNYANRFRVTPSYIYKLIRGKVMSVVTIDGVMFIDSIKFPKIPTKN